MLDALKSIAVGFGFIALCMFGVFLAAKFPVVMGIIGLVILAWLIGNAIRVSN